MKYIYEPIFNPILNKWEVRYGNDKSNLKFRLFKKNEKQKVEKFIEELQNKEETA